MYLIKRSNCCKRNCYLPVCNQPIFYFIAHIERLVEKITIIYKAALTKN